MANKGRLSQDIFQTTTYLGDHYADDQESQSFKNGSMKTESMIHTSAPELDID